jgi:hypothetical protein
LGNFKVNGRRLGRTRRRGNEKEHNPLNRQKMLIKSKSEGDGKVQSKQNKLAQNGNELENNQIINEK